MRAAGRGSRSGPGEHHAGNGPRRIDRRAFVRGALGMAGFVPAASVLPKPGVVSALGDRGVVTPDAARLNQSVVIVGGGRRRPGRGQGTSSERLRRRGPTGGA